MKISVKTLGSSKFDIEVNPDDRVSDVKKNIETVEGLQAYPASQQILIHRGKVLKDDTTLNENNVAENNFIVITLTKVKSSTSTGGSTATATPTAQAPPSSMARTASPVSAPPTPVQAPTTTATPVPAPTLSVTAPGGSDVYGEAASNLVVGSNLEGTIQELLEVGGGMWDKDNVARALRAAFNNPERVVDYLYSGIPEQPDLAPATQAGTGGEALVPSTQQTPQPAQAAVSSGGPNANPLDLFPQGLPNTGGANAAAACGGGGGNLEFLRNNPQFETMQAMVQANPQILESMFEELGKQNPQILRLIQEHPNDFINLLDGPAQGEENMMEQLDANMPQQVAVTPEELEAIERLEAMGFDRAVVLQVFFACNKNEEVVANYLLDHGHEFD